jgi:hypothetical protein
MHTVGPISLTGLTCLTYIFVRLGLKRWAPELPTEDCVAVAALIALSVSAGVVFRLWHNLTR